MEKVADLEVYVQRMQKSFMDKMFFIDKIFEPIDTILDFGCANGVLIRAMQYLFPEYSYVGYDISEDMIKKAKELLHNLILRGVQKLKSLFKGSKSRSEIVATFLAILELCKTNSVSLEDDVTGENPNVRLLDEEALTKQGDDVNGTN